MTVPSDRKEAVETLAAEFHAVYQAEARRQGDVRHHDDYDALPENVKEFDRVLARHVLAVVERYENALREITKQNWESLLNETPFQFEQRLHRIAAAALAGTEESA